MEITIVTIPTLSLKAKLIWRLLTFSARTQISFTVYPDGSVFLEDGIRHVEFILDDRSFERPKTVIIPAKFTKFDNDVAQVFIPEWILEARYYPLLEKYLCVLFKLDYVPDRFVPIVALPRPLYDQFLQQSALRLNSKWKKVKSEEAVLYELIHENYLDTLTVKQDGIRAYSFLVHLEPRGEYAQA